MIRGWSQSQISRTISHRLPPSFDQPPWALQQDLKQAGMLDQGLQPKKHLEFWVNEMRSTKAKDGAFDFIDISQTEYMESPGTHLHRLWKHFQESEA